jgi:hypothetical protein
MLSWHYITQSFDPAKYHIAASSLILATYKRFRNTRVFCSFQTSHKSLTAWVTCHSLGLTSWSQATPLGHDQNLIVKRHLKRRWAADSWAWLQNLWKSQFCQPRRSSLYAVQTLFWRTDEAKKKKKHFGVSQSLRTVGAWLRKWGPQIAYCSARTMNKNHCWLASISNWPVLVLSYASSSFPIFSSFEFLYHFNYCVFSFSFILHIHIFESKRVRES